MLSEKFKVKSCGDCEATVKVLIGENSPDKAEWIAEEIAKHHCNDEKNMRPWSFSNKIKKVDKDDLKRFDELSKDLEDK